ncbi:MAG: DUF5625 family protein [Desulfobulbus sp.]|nr:DUF5625 family protein [Desulfobulbus sp.]
MYKAGAKIETEVRIVERYSYSFTLSFLYRDQADFARMKKLTGDRYVNAGIPIPLSLTIFKLDANGQHLLFTKEISEFPTYAWGGSIDKKIVDVFLETGQYAIRVECLQDIPELQDTKMNFVLVKNYRK